MMEKYKACPQWEEIFSTTLFSEDNVNNFDSKINYKIAQYDPASHGILFLNNLVYGMAKKIEERLHIFEKIKNRGLLGGHSISYRGVELNLDYLQALDECFFLENILKSSSLVLEIGAGYGRTCHSILSLHQTITLYEIVDFPEMLALSKKYLKQVLDKETFSKIQFVDFRELSSKELDGPLYDLVVHINSMQQMPQKTVHEYFNFIDRYAKNFYTKDTVGKFSPAMIGAPESLATKLALSAGILTEEVNIFCPDDLNAARKRFLVRFAPSAAWTVEAHAEVAPWSHFYQALYSRLIL
jgi:hypothetical protein